MIIVETLLVHLLKVNDRLLSNLRRTKTSSLLRPNKQSIIWQHQQASVVVGLSIALTFITIFLCTLIRTQRLLDGLDSRACMEIPSILTQNGDSTFLSDRFIIFQPIMEGQGTGNIMSGLLAAHLLGLEFNRTVCVSDSYTDFYMAFEIANPVVAATCRQLLECEKPVFQMQHHIRLINYLAAPNECSLQEKVASDTRVLWIMANTYPCWPQDDTIPDNFFFANYQARKRLVDMLPYRHENPPRTVVHLRFQDGSRDFRKGLDNATLHNLGQSLPKQGTYLVSNHVAFFELFEREYGWQHPVWDAVTHSALAISWGNRKNESVRRIVRRGTAEQEKQTMQLWADWYTLLLARYIVHTASDFSSSAAHWMKIDSMIIEGSDGPENDMIHHNVRLASESWRRDNATAALQ
jgi:hypothetical protein